MFIVNFNTGAGNQQAPTLEEAKQKAVDSISFTQQHITIEDEHGNVVSIARWYGVEPTEEDEVLERIAGGFYQRWSDELE
ncbi:hypothetical protein [Paenibacillus campinasensis]|uniref:Uncharacterized protein n=1 Tax=Paenibacillus campinasensis TaxID=66347 RepID=A0A268EIB2_9BACL|nr:hypothetical protein [Paenibacillus campinasensis]PAD72863.1 hypothetical protein CHH67_21390 [Paenibacillus campinasensis]